MKYWLVGVFGATLLVLQPGTVAAQCEGGTTLAGYYGPDGVYVPGHCAVTNPFTPGQLHPSGARPVANTPSEGVLTTTATPATGIAQAETVRRVVPGRVREAAAPLPLHVGDPTGAYGTSLPAAPAVSTEGAATTSLLGGGDHTGAYGTTLVAAGPPRGVTDPAPDGGD
jgi:hypothetical protein